MALGRPEVTDGLERIEDVRARTRVEGALSWESSEDVSPVNQRTDPAPR